MPKSALVLLRTAGPVKHPSTFSPPSLPRAAGQHRTMPGAGTAALGTDLRAGDGGRRWHEDDASAVGATGVLVCPQDQPWARHRLPKPGGGVPPFCHLWGPGTPSSTGGSAGLLPREVHKTHAPQSCLPVLHEGGPAPLLPGLAHRVQRWWQGLCSYGKGRVRNSSPI